MPKQFLKLSNFNNGLVESIDPRDISDNALAKAENINLDKTLGVIESPIKENDQGDVGAVSSTVVAGFGLFQFEADHREGSSASDAGEVYIALCDPGNAEIDIWDKTNDNWATAVNLGSTGGVQAVMHFVDEGLRVSDALFGTNNSNKIYQYIKRTHFSGLSPGGSADTYDDWFTNDQKLSAPTRGLYGETLGYESTQTCTASSGDTALNNTTGNPFPVHWDTELDSGTYIAIPRGTITAVDTISSRTTSFALVTASGGATWATGVTYALFPAAGTGFNLDLSTNASGGSWPAGSYNFATSFIYDGNQESLLYENSGQALSVSDDDSIDCTVMCTSPFDERITGGRIYVREDGEKGDWVLFGEIDLRSGVRSKTFGTYTSWTLESQPATELYLHAQLKSLSPNIETYEILNGFSHEESAIDIGQDGEGYKTSVISNRRCFVANVKTKNEDGETIQMRDRIMYSPVGRFDTFPRSFFVDVVRGDAEEWVKLEEFNDRLLAFKSRSLYIINISSPSPSGWFLEDRYEFAGVETPASVTKIEGSGVVFANERGCYIYDGSSLKNMIDGKIKPSTWSDFMGDVPLVGFSNKYSRLYVIAGASGTVAYEYSFVSNSWVKLDSFVAGLLKTNFIIDYNGDAVVAENDGGTIRLLKATDTARQSGTFTVDVEFKDIDFGNPAQLKKVYAIYVTYQSTGAITTPIKYFQDTDVSGTLTGNFANTSGGYEILKAVPASPFTCQSIQPRLEMVNPTEYFQIKDLTIEYRPIHKRAS